MKRRGTSLGRGCAAALTVALVALLLAATASAATTFTVRGSAEQVDVTGLAGGASASLVNAGGHTVATQAADSLGGLLFRNVAPGAGYRVRLNPNGPESAPVTVHTNAAAPWDPSVYNQSIPDNGYTYLTTRDGTQLAIDVHPPTSPAGEPGLPSGVALPSLPTVPGAPTLPDTAPYPTLIEYSATRWG